MIKITSCILNRKLFLFRIISSYIIFFNHKIFNNKNKYFFTKNIFGHKKRASQYSKTWWHYSLRLGEDENQRRRFLESGGPYPLFTPLFILFSEWEFCREGHDHCPPQFSTSPNFTCAINQRKMLSFLFVWKGWKDKEMKMK